MRFRLLLLLPLTLLAACGGDDGGVVLDEPRYAPTSAALLSTGSPTKDEDPSVLLAQDGSIVVAWFSDRGGNNDIYITRSTQGTEWAAPARVTVSADGDFYPNLIQDANGVFHLTWFRWYAVNRGHIWYNRSTNPLVWDSNTESQVTTAADVDDWVPSIAPTADSLRIFFVSKLRNPTTNEIYYASSHIDSLAWSAARPFPNNSPFLHDHLPFAAWTGSQLDLVWVRHGTSKDNPWENPAPPSEICYSFSPDGVTWSAEMPVTIDPMPAVNIFPEIYRRSGGAWRLLWTSTRSDSAEVLELPMSQLAAYPAGIVHNTKVEEGYSHRVTRTSVSGLYFAAWVQPPVGAEDVYYRFYTD